MRRAIAKLDGIEEADIAVDYAAKTATIALGEGDPAIDAIVASVSGTKYSLTAKP